MKKELKDLRENAQKLLNDMRAIHSGASAQKRSMNDEENSQYERMQADFNESRKEIGRIEQMEEATRYMGEILTAPVRDAIGGDHKDSDMESHKREFLSMIRGGEFDMRVLRALTVGSDANGGYTVPTVLLNTVIKALSETNFMRQLGTVVTTTSTTNIPIGATKPTFALIAENGAYPAVDATFGVKTLKAYKVGGVILASDELLNDSGVNIEQYITGLIIEGIGAFEENKFILGSGTSDYQGLTTATVGVTSASPTALTSDEVLDLFYSVGAKYRPQSTFVVGDSFEKAVMKLKDTTGRYLWNMGMTAGVPNMLNNRPIYNSAYVPALAATNVVAAFGDMSYFNIADRGTMIMKRLNELYAGSGQVGFQVSKRGDSRITLDEAIKTFKMHA